MPAVSVFTPSHRPTFLDEAYASLKAQTLEDWEWVVLLNNGVQWEPPDDPRVRVERADDLKGVGALKRRACVLLTSDIFVELDHDDVLVSTALEKVLAAFEAHPEIGFVYSDTAQITEKGGYDESRFDERNGWIYSDVKVDG